MGTMRTRRLWLRFRLGLGTLGVLGCCLGASAWAQAEAGIRQPLQSTMAAFLVEKDADGKEKLTKTDQIKPGQVIQYALTYSNVTDSNLTSVSILGPVPGGTVYLAGSADAIDGSAPQFSIDAGVSFKPEPVTYTVELADGTKEERIATPDMYTHVRWTVMTFAARRELALKYRVRVR